MKNVFYIVLDAFCYDNLEKSIGNEYITPFLNSLKHRSFYTTSLYAQAPYTEASMVTILSGENTLDHGGYLFGNGDCKNTIFKEYKDKNYTTLTNCSPYVYTQAYNRYVDELFYTRIFTIEPLISYRLSWYKDRYLSGIGTSEDLQICRLLLKEAFQTWLDQAQGILNNLYKCILIQDFVLSRDSIKEVLIEVKAQFKCFEQDPELYLIEMFRNWDHLHLLEINKKYNARKPLPCMSYIKSKYAKIFSTYQKKYQKYLRCEKLDLRYIFNTLFTAKDKHEFLALLHNYYRIYNNKFLSGYLDSISEYSKVEVSIQKQFEFYLNKSVEMEKECKNFFTYIHTQDFHLPSMFFSVDSDDDELIDHEICEAMKLLDKMDINYRGNIIADLSAHYVDRKLQSFFESLQNSLKKDFVFLVTADHGYPYYFNPPRPIIYNQTYSEAFHVPCIIYDSSNKKENMRTGLLSNMDTYDLVLNISGLQNKVVNDRTHILTEYGGPGCPDLHDKKIWYTYIDQNYRISVECHLSEDVTVGSIKAVYRLDIDPKEKYNLVKKIRSSTDINKIIQVINLRHHQIQSKMGEDFKGYIINNLRDITPND